MVYWSHQHHLSNHVRQRILHIMLRISAHGKREAAFDFREETFVIRVFEMTGSQHGFLGIVKRNAQEAVPVANKIVFG